MLEFIVKYWVEFGFGLIALGVTGYFKYQYSQLKKMKSAYEEQEKEDFLKEVYEKIDAIKDSMENKIEDLGHQMEDFSKVIIHVQDGILAVQYDRLNYICMRCLKYQEVSEKDYLNIQQLYKSYKENNGNHGMDEIYHAVMKLPVVEQYKDED